MDKRWPVLERQVVAVRAGQVVRQEQAIVLEEPLALYVNDRHVALMMRLPGMEKELAVGYCVSEGLVRSARDIFTVQHCGQGLPEPAAAEPAAAEPAADDAEPRNRVDVRVDPEGLNPEARLDVVRLVRAGCGAVDLTSAALPFQPLAASVRVTAAVLLGLGSALRGENTLHEAAGGVHAAALFDAGGTLLALAEDVGRHNAVDKVIGQCLLRGVGLSETVMLCSGRLSYEMVAKALRVRIPVLVSLSAPTSLAVELADTFGLTMVGYLRGGRMTIYAHEERIVLPEPPTTA
jgi:FdhD protein